MFRIDVASYVFQHEQASEEASTILGDKLQQKMDSVTFAQERMKRQLKDLQEKVQGTPADVTDIKDRIEVGRYQQADMTPFSFFSVFKGEWRYLQGGPSAEIVGLG